MPSKKRKKDTLYSFDPRDVLHVHRQLFLYSVINDSVANGIKQNLIAFDIVNNQQPITLWLSSPGGSCSAGLSIIEVMNKISSPIITIVSGETCSMASLISVCGDVRWTFSTSSWMQHSMASGQSDYLNYIRDRTAYLERFDKVLTDIMKENTKLTPDDYKKIETGELWLLGPEMVTKGVADKII